MTLGRGHFWPHGHNLHNLNKLGRGSLGDANYQILVVSDMKILSCFPILVYVKYVSIPGASPFLAQGA